MLRRIANGDQAAFTLLFRHYQAYIYSAAIKLTGSTVLAEEIVQDVFLKIWMIREQLPEVRFFSAYLYKVAENIIYPALRKMNRERLSQVDISIIPQDGGGAGEVRVREVERMLEEAVNRLPDRQRETYLLARSPGLTRTEIARLLKVSPETVKSNLSQALRSIRAYCMVHLDAFLPAVLLQVFL